MKTSSVIKNVPAYPKDKINRKQNDTLPTGVDTAAETAVKELYLQDGLSTSVLTAFRRLVYDFFEDYQRQLPWRQQVLPWHVLVSEVMLQQTQVDRVLPKFIAFTSQFPDPASLAAAALTDLLAAWQGLGYNRRALNLQRTARMIVEEWDNCIPDDPALLRQLPGIGPYTAGAIAAFAFNRPSSFLETNIRTVLLHFFFANQEDVSDKELLPVVEAILDREQPRVWYNALMDYGSDLKRRFPNPSRRSRHHTVQSGFNGSDRQVRGAILRLLLAENGMQLSVLQQRLKIEPKRLHTILDGIIQDGFLKKQGKQLIIP